MFLSVNSRAASAYSRVGVQTGVDGADPHELINLLFNGLMQSLSQAKGALERGDIPTKCQALSKSVRLLDEGLRSVLNPAGGELTDNLNRLYEYCIRRLTEANLHNDIARIDEVKSLIEPIADGWRGIRDQLGKGN